MSRGGGRGSGGADGKEKLTLGAWRVPRTLLDRLNAAAWHQRVSAAALVREFLDASLTRLEKRNGGRFPRPPAGR